MLSIARLTSMSYSPAFLVCGLVHPVDDSSSDVVLVKEQLDLDLAQQGLELHEGAGHSIEGEAIHNSLEQVRS
jgi:hypothetical protein